MLCIGFGRWPPQNTTEVWLTIISMMTGATFYALFIGNMSTLLLSIDSSGRLYNEKVCALARSMAVAIDIRLHSDFVTNFMHQAIGYLDQSALLYLQLSQVEEYMRYRKLPQNIRMRVQEFYEHRYRKKYFNEETILEELSTGLKEVFKITSKAILA